MTEEWKQQLCLEGKVTEKHAEEIFKIIEDLLEEQRKELTNRKLYQQAWGEGYEQGVAVGVTNGQKGLIETILSEAPPNKIIPEFVLPDNKLILSTNNYINNLWRELLTKHLI